jgi:hypothetical protein
MQAAGFTGTYIQDMITNGSTGATASADYVVNNALSTDSSTYGDFGINSPNFTGTGSLNLPNATYLYAQGGDLTLGTSTANSVHITTSGAATDAVLVGPGNTTQVATLIDSSGATGLPGQVLLKTSTGGQLWKPEPMYVRSAMMGVANSYYGFYCLQPLPPGASITPNPVTDASDSYGNGLLNPIIMPFNWAVGQLNFACAHCAVSQGSVGASPAVRIEFFSHTISSRTSIGFVDVPLVAANVDIYNNLGTSKFQAVTVPSTGVTGLSGSTNDLIGWQFTPLSSNNNQINALAQSTLNIQFVGV